MLLLILYFVIGFIEDMLATIDIKAVQRNKAYTSAVITFTLTVTGLGVFYNIITTEDWAGIVSYAMGGAMGVIFTMVLIPKIKLLYWQRKGLISWLLKKYL
jgi:hypothetical protein